MITGVMINKSAWGPGPWQTEPDRLDFISHGFACLALRHPHHGHWCGYVGVPEGHPRFGKESDEMGDLRFHGGVNYAEPCEGDICHTPAPGMPDHVWWIGGDFGHHYDISPGMEALLSGVVSDLSTRDPEASRFLNCGHGRARYRDVAYVRHEIEQLAAQLDAEVRIV